MNPIALAITGLTHSYVARRVPPVTALRDLSFEVSEGTVTAVIGPNGSGKSTLFRVLAGLLPVQEGSVAYRSSTIPAPSNTPRHVGFVFQSPALDKELTVFENLYHHVLLYGRRITRDSLPDWFSDSLGLTPLLDKKIDELSGGFQRRVELAKVLLAEPSVIILDEPFAGLDLQTRDAFFKLVQSLSRDRNLTVIVMTHVLPVAELCDSVVVLEEGRCIAHDTPSNLLAEFGAFLVEIHTKQLPVILARIAAQYPTRTVRLDNERALVLYASLTQILEIVDAQKDGIDVIEARKPSLEDYFIARTGKAYDAGGSRSLAA